MVSLQAFGAGVNLIGKKIDGQADLKINGEVVGQTIIVQGKSYAPVREITDGVGGTVVYNKSGGAVEMSVADIAQAEQEQLKIEEDKANLKQQIELKNKQIAELESEINKNEIEVAELKAIADADTSITGAAKTKYNVFKTALDDSKTRLNSLKSELSSLESQLKALES